MIDEGERKLLSILLSIRKRFAYGNETIRRFLHGIAGLWDLIEDFSQPAEDDPVLLRHDAIHRLHMRLEARIVDNLPRQLCQIVEMLAKLHDRIIRMSVVNRVEREHA